MRDSSNAASLMADPTPAEPQERRFDLWLWAAGAFFMLAVAAASTLAWEQGPGTLAGLLLLVGLAGVALLGLLGFRGSAAPIELEEDGAETFVEALPEAAAVTGADGRVHAANDAWREALGVLRRLPRNGHAAPGLFAALAKARKGEIGRAAVKVGGEERPLMVSPMGVGRFLIRLDAAPVEPLRLTTTEAAAVAAVAASAPVIAQGPAALDALAAASPFGAAMLEGEEVFGAVIIEANPALAAMTAGKAAAGLTFGDLIDPHSRIDAGFGAAEGQAGPIEVRLAHDPSRISHLYLARTNGRLSAYLIDVSEQKQIELHLDELLERHPLGDPSYEGLTSIKGTAARAADLVRKLKTYSRQETLQREVLDLGETISDFEVLLRRLVRETRSEERR